MPIIHLSLISLRPSTPFLDMIIYFLGWVLQFAFKGTEAIDRSDVYYTISDLDHPVSALLQSPFEINKGMSALIGITKKEVNIILCNLKQLIWIWKFHLSSFQIDKTALRSKFCETKPAYFLKKYNIPYTKLNCEILQSQSYLPCSLNRYYGLYHGKKLFS